MRGGVSLAVAVGGLARLGTWALGVGQPPVLAARGLDVPDPSQFLRHPFPAVAVLGDYVYIDGGELSQLVDGQMPQGQPSFPGAWTTTPARRRRGSVGSKSRG